MDSAPTYVAAILKEFFFKNEEILRNILDNMKHINMCIIEIPGEESKQRIENVFEETITKNFPNLVKEKDTQVQAQKVPN